MTLASNGHGLADHVSALAASAARIADVADAHSLLHEGVAALGAQCAYFATFVVDDGEASYRFVIDCNPGWWHRYREGRCMECDPWLAYAREHCEPALASALNSLTPEQKRTTDLAVEAGFVATLLVPVHSAIHDARVSLLALGHSDARRFQGDDYAVVRVMARAFALELHDWWGSQLRRTLLDRARLSPADVRLLERHCAGLSSKQIARDLRISPAAVNSRFQRMTVRLGARNRRAVARIAIECGLIVK